VAARHFAAKRFTGECKFLFNQSNHTRSLNQEAYAQTKTCCSTLRLDGP
jgi:hypothetical protein